MHDPYTILGVSPDATEAELKQAYRRRARETHPDRHPGDPTAEARFKAVAAAWEAVSDRERRREHDDRRARVRRGALPEEFLDDVASAVERAQTWIEEGVLPEIARHWRGAGAEMAARFVEELESFATPRALPPAPWLARRRAARLAASVHVALDAWRGPDLSALMRGPRGWELLVSPQGLWHGGLRDSGALDDAVLRLMLARYAQLVAHGRYVPRGSPAEVALARAVDDLAVKRALQRWLVWALFAAFVAALLFSGYASRWQG